MTLNILVTIRVPGRVTEDLGVRIADIVCEHLGAAESECRQLNGAYDRRACSIDTTHYDRIAD